MRKCVLFLSSLVFCLTSFAATKVCIDPGHGGSDPGAVGYVQEAGVNLDASLKLRSWLNLDTSDTAGGSSWSVYMTRTGDTTVSLTARTNYANNNGVARFLSIHSNAATAAAYGSETFSYASTGTGSLLRNVVQNELISHGGLYNRGNKVANFHVLRETSMPAALTELGFVTNASDSASLGSSTWRNEVAKGFMHAFQRHYGYSAYTPSSTVTVTVDNASSNFTASSNWWTSTSTAGYYGSNYHVRSTEAISDAATFKANLPSSGSWKVYAWWTAGSNRAASAPYIVYHTGGSTTVSKNQQSSGGQWVLLGTFSMNSGTADRVKLSCWTTAGYYVVADAVKFVK